MLQQLPVERLISHHFAVADAPAAYALIDRQPQDTLQVLLTYQDFSNATGPATEP
jgi:threonine dehydrogenase-like Zn-dependent dehydrogenase